MKNNKKNSSKIQYYFLIIFFITAIGIYFILAPTLTGAALKRINKCEFLKGNEVSNYLAGRVHPNPTGDNFCAYHGYRYAAFVEKQIADIIFDSVDGKCFTNGKIQVDSKALAFSVPGDTSLNNWEKSQCVTNTDKGSTEPSYGDQFQINTYNGILCCP